MGKMSALGSLLAAKRRHNAAHGARRGKALGNNPALKGAKEKLQRIIPVGLRLKACRHPTTTALGEPIRLAHRADVRIAVDEQAAGGEGIAVDLQQVDLFHLLLKDA